VLDLLAERPARYLALVRRAQRLVEDQLDDGQIVDANVTRSLQRLQRAGLVHADIQRQGRRRLAVYRLTDRGREVLGSYRVILTAYAQGRSPDGGAR
jgi:DNA-binding PadR family transcriptional regulator